MAFEFTSADMVGMAAGTLTTTSLIPQVWRIVQTRSARDISWGMFFVFAAGTALWFAWGVMQGALPVILANSVTLVLATVILVLKWRYGGPAHHGRPALTTSEQQKETT
jgi:MtN3 and saliva related transmembrane protein